MSTMTTYQIPSFYDSTEKSTRPMDSGAAIPPAQVPVSAVAGNSIQVLADGIYQGQQAIRGQFTTLYVSSTGTDAPTSGSKTTPYQTLDYALAQAAALFPASQFDGPVYIALRAGQTFALNNDFTVYGGTLGLTFYNDAQYGDFNAVIGTGALSQVMADLARPIITPQSSVVAGQNHMAGIIRAGGSVLLLGVQVNLPVVPANPSIAIYGLNVDFIRNPDFSSVGYVWLMGAIINMVDINAFWGFLGTMSQSTGCTLTQFASQFQIAGTLLSATLIPAPTTAQLTARQYFVKFFAGYAGNNQQAGLLDVESATSSPGSGLINLNWADTEALTVEAGKTNQASFPIMFDASFGFKNYLFGITRDQQQRPLNVISSRLF